MATVSVSGIIRKEPELKQTRDNTAILKVNLAEQGYNHRTREKETRWWGVSIFKNADKLVSHLHDGMVLVVSGEMETELYNGKIQHRLIANEVKFYARSGEGGGSKREAGGRAGYGVTRSDAPAEVPEDDDLPF